MWKLSKSHHCCSSMELHFDPRRRCLKRRRARRRIWACLNMMIRGGVRGGKRRFQATTTSGSLRHEGGAEHENNHGLDPRARRGDREVVSHRRRSLKRRPWPENTGFLAFLFIENSENIKIERGLFETGSNFKFRTM